MDKITVELTREDAMLLRDFLDEVNFYVVGAALSRRPGAVSVTEDDVARHRRAVNHAHLALEKALRK